MLYEVNAMMLPWIRLVNIAKVEPPYVHIKRRVEEFIVYFVRKGNLYLVEDETKYILSQGDFFVLDPKHIHKGYKSSFCEYYYIHFEWNRDLDGMKKIKFSKEQEMMSYLIQKRNDALQSDSCSYQINPNEICMIPKKYHISNYNDFIRICYILDEAIRKNEYQLENYKVLCGGKIMEAFVEVARSFVMSQMENVSTGIPKSYLKIQHLMEFLNSEYARKVTSEEIEQRFDCNFDYINRVFKKITSRTIFSYLNMVRINHAKELLSTTGMKVAEVGEQVGYSDEFYFSKVFKKATGIAPNTYAKAMLNR